MIGLRLGDNNGNRNSLLISLDIQIQESRESPPKATERRHVGSPTFKYTGFFL